MFLLFLFFSRYTGRGIGTNVVAVSGVFGGIQARGRFLFFLMNLSFVRFGERRCVVEGLFAGFFENR